MGTQAPTQGRGHAQTSRGKSAWRGVRRRNGKYPGWKVAAPTHPRGGKVFSRKNKLDQIQRTKKKKMTHRPVHSPVPRYTRTGYPGRHPGSGLRRASAGRNGTTTKKGQSCASNSGVSPELWPDNEQGIRQDEKKKNGKNRPTTRPRH